MPIATVTLSSANIPGQSAAVNLSYRIGSPISVAVYTSTTGASTGVFTIQYTLDDTQLVGGSSLAVWANLSSAVGVAAVAFNSSTAGTDGAFYSLLSPVAALRVSSTASSSGGFTMKVIQGEVI
jgi:hypothetical protein